MEFLGLKFLPSQQLIGQSLPSMKTTENLWSKIIWLMRWKTYCPGKAARLEPFTELCPKQWGQTLPGKQKEGWDMLRVLRLLRCFVFPLHGNSVFPPKQGAVGTGAASV